MITDKYRLCLIKFRKIFIGVSYFISFTLVLLVTRDAWKGPLFGDDWPNSMVNLWLRWLNGLSSLDGFFQQTFLWTRGWADGQGRLFPFAVMTTRGSFIFLDIDQYRFLKYFILILLIFVSSYFIFKILGKVTFLSTAIITTLVTIQFRYDYDPYLGFTMLLPLSATYVLMGGFLLRKNIINNFKFRSFFYILLSSLLFFMALTTYEYSILLFPAAIYYALNNIDLKYKLKKILISALAFLPSMVTIMWTLFILRPNRENRLPSYEVSFNLTNNLVAFTSQIYASIPVSQILSGIENYPHLGDKKRFLLILIMLLIIFLIDYLYKPKFQLKKSHVIITLALSIYLIVTPALMVSLTSRWSGDNLLQVGQAYLPILIQNIGVSWLIYTFLILVKYVTINNFKNHSTLVKLLILLINFLTLSLLAFVISLLVAINHNKVKNGDFQKERMWIVQQALQEDFDGYLRSGNRLISWEQNDAFEINRAVFSEFSGIDFSSLNHPLELWSKECLENNKCELEDAYEILSYTKNVLVENPNYREDKNKFWNLYNNETRLIREEIKLNSKNSIYYLDATFYQGGIVLAFSPIVNIEGEIFVDRSNIYIRWYKVKESIDPPAKYLGDEICLTPANNEFKNGTYSNSISSFENILIPIRDVPVGQFC